MLALKNNYDGKPEVKHRKHVAKEGLRRLFYRNETSLAFEKYIT